MYDFIRQKKVLEITYILPFFFNGLFAIEVKQDNAQSHSNFGNNIKNNNFLVLKP